MLIEKKFVNSAGRKFKQVENGLQLFLVVNKFSAIDYYFDFI